MSTDGSGADAPPDPVRRFHHGILVVVVALLLVVAGLTAANSVQGARLVRAQVSPDAAVERAGQHLVLQLDQVVDPVPSDAVATLPHLAVVARTDGSTLDLQLQTTLAYATTYQVEVPLVSRATGAASVLRYGFTTPPATLYTLHRAQDSDDQPDTIERVTAGVTTPQPVRTLPRIQEYAVADPDIAVVTADADGLDTLQVGPLDPAHPSDTVLSGVHLSQLKASGSAGLFGFVVTTETEGTTSNPVHLLLYQTGSRTGPLTVTGLGGLPVEVRDWAFVPGTSAVVVQDQNNGMFLLDPVRGAVPKALGDHLEIHGLGRGATLVVGDAQNRYTRIDLTTGRTEPLLDLRLGSGLPRRITPLGERDRFVAVLNRYSAGDLHSSAVTLGPRRRPHLLYTPPAGATVEAVCLSPNEQLVAVTASVETAGSYADDPDPVGSVTTVVDLGTDEHPLVAPGSAADWCTR
ncbi:hypothetical protein [uncultured Friedmanniella sp.]|uniref:hypothetical protein n=1 Tax=uncultured Friedmanniella sp. TaxID=335381 RepID=UPI0035C9A1F2